MATGPLLQRSTRLDSYFAYVTMSQIKTLLISKLISHITKALCQTQSWSSSGHTLPQKVKLWQLHQNMCSIDSTYFVHNEMLAVTEQL